MSVLLSLSFLKVLGGTGAPVDSLFGAGPRKDGADSWMSLSVPVDLWDLTEGIIHHF